LPRSSKNANRISPARCRQECLQATNPRRV